MILDSEKCYYEIIPANVRYDENLIPNAKFLYGEIIALCNAKGYCWPTNDYFSRLYSVSKKNSLNVDKKSQRCRIHCIRVCICE